MVEAPERAQKQPDEYESPRVIKPKRLAEDIELDMTPMIDCTFLLLIFFMVSSTPEASTELKLAPARNGANIVVQEAAIISMAENLTGENAFVYLGDGKVGDPLPNDLVAQEEAIKAYVRQQYAGDEPKSYVLIKAERSVKNKETLRVSAAASAAFEESEAESGDEDEEANRVELHVAVLDQR